MKRKIIILLFGMVAMAILFFMGISTISTAYDKAIAVANANNQSYDDYTRAYEATLVNNKQIGTIMSWVGGAGTIVCIGGIIYLIKEKQ